jgi:hypothetical protein
MQERLACVLLPAPLVCITHMELRLLTLLHAARLHLPGA